MEFEPKKIFTKLTIQLELFTHLVPVPLLIYFSIVVAAFKNPDEQMIGALSGGASGGLMVLLGVLWRYFVLKGDLETLNKLNEDNSIPISEIEHIKLHLLKHPFNEGKVIMLRWFAGVIIAHILVLIFIGYRPVLHLTIPFVFLIIIPISYVAYLFLSENIIRHYLHSPNIRNVQLDINDIPKMNYFYRLLLAIFALAIMPITLLGYLLFAVTQGNISLENPLFHICIITAMFLVPVIIATYAVARAVKNGLYDINFVLGELGKGKLDVKSVPASADEFGKQAHHLGLVINNLRDMYNQIKDLNENLEQKVIERTEELRRSLEEIKKMKHQQDGDYFLTSLLLKPLNYNHVYNKMVNVDFFIKQKKKFSFKQWNEEIGGDLCCAAEIKLRKKSYMVFANADAMGKSIQGAGGALVFGAVFQALVERTLFLPEFQDQMPETWLRYSFIELHKIFETFDGSMLISAVIGLIDIETGLVYYMNAEHPYPILFRDGKAQFLPDIHIFRKFGTCGVRGQLYVQCFQLQLRDSLWIGSDGKDDICLQDKKEERVINEDELLILKVLEESKGNLKQTFENLQKKGEITDEFSLRRNSYGVNALPESEKKDLDEIENKICKLFREKLYQDIINTAEELGEKIQILSPPILKRLASTYYNTKNYLQAANIAEKYYDKCPDDCEMIYLNSVAYKKAKNFNRAMDLAECLRLRNPSNVKYMTNLCELYYYTGKYQKTEKMVNRILLSDSENKKAARLKELLTKVKINA
jgi:hypothetical protein